MEPTSYGAFKMSSIQTGKKLVEAQEHIRLRDLYKEKVGISAPTSATTAELETGISDPEGEKTCRILEELQEAQLSPRRDLY
jgi:hypothetical protein